MPKTGTELIRRKALVEAAIRQVGAKGLDVTVAEIAREAGMSPALAHHYFGGKEQMFEGAMRRILADLAAAIRARAAAEDRVEAIVRACFEPASFEPVVVSAWLNFYVQAQRAPGAARLLRIYHARMRSNLRDALRRGGHRDPEALAELVAAQIDGVYLRAALGGEVCGAQAVAQVMSLVRRPEGAHFGA